MKKYNLLDRIIVLFMTFMIMSIYLFELESWGRYVLLAISLFVALIYAFQNGWKFTLIIGEPFPQYVLTFSAFCFLSALWAWVPSLAISKGLTILLILGCFSLLYPYYRKYGSIDPLLLTFLLSGYGICIYAFLYYGVSGIRTLLADGTRLGNDFTNVNSIGMTAAMSCIIQVFYLLKKEKRLLSVFMLPAILMIAVSQSRKAIVMLILGVMFVVMYCGQRKGHTTKLMRYIIGIIVLVSMLYLMLRMDIFSGVLGRWDDLLDSLLGDSEEDIRTIYRKIGWQQFLKTPVLGIGMGNSLELLQASGQRRTYLHCNYVELLASGGIVGFVCYYAMYVKLAWSFWKYRKHQNAEANLCTILMILLLAMDYGMTSYYDKQQYLYLMCFFLQAEIMHDNYSRGRCNNSGLTENLQGSQ